MRGSQGINGKHPVDVTEHDEVFLGSDTWDRVVRTAAITVITTPHWNNYLGNVGQDPYHIPAGLNKVCPQVLNIGCKAFIQPQVVPPPYGHQITKPLKGKHREMHDYYYANKNKVKE